MIDKARAAGGRLATRRIGAGLADVGAQFVSARTAPFQSLVREWEARGLIYLWSHGWADASGQPQGDGHPRYAVRGGAQALARALTTGLDVRLTVKLTALTPVREGWQATDESGQVFTARAVVVTTPVPQALALVETGRAPLLAADLEALRRLRYAPCLAGVFALDGAPQLPEPGAVQLPEHPVTWLADNQRKGISPAQPVLTVHAGADFSRAHYNDADGEVLTRLLAAAAPWLGPASVRESQLKRWRYARPITSHPQPYLLAEGVPPLLFAGDAFSVPRVEGAVLSGLAAAEKMAALLG